MANENQLKEYQSNPTTNMSKEAASQIKILLAEDNVVNQTIFKKLLASCGFQTTIVANGKEAVEQFKSNMFDLILMDLQVCRKKNVRKISFYGP